MIEAKTMRGGDSPHPARRFNATTLTAAAAGLLLLLIVGAAALWVIAPDLRSEGQTDRADETEAIVGAKTAVVARSPDATSITFGKVVVNWLGDTPAVCGRVDIEEPQDSFDGEERFIYFNGEALAEEMDGTDAMDGRWKDLCQSY